MLRPGFEPGISGSKGQNACPDYTTGAQDYQLEEGRLYIFSRAPGDLEARPRAHEDAPHEWEARYDGHQGPESLGDIRKGEWEQPQEGVHEVVDLVGGELDPHHPGELDDVDGQDEETEHRGDRLIQLAYREAHHQPHEKPLDKNVCQGLPENILHDSLDLDFCWSNKKRDSSLMCRRLFYLDARLLFLLGARSSAWWSNRLITCGSWVQIPPGPPHF